MTFAELNDKISFITKAGQDVHLLNPFTGKGFRRFGDTN